MGLVKYIIRDKGRYIRRQCWYMTGIIYGLVGCWTGFDTRVDKEGSRVGPGPAGVKWWVLNGIGGPRLIG